MNSKIFFRILTLVVVMFAALNASAQPSGFDPAMIQQRLMDGYRAQLSITNDAEWTLVQERIQKVIDARRLATPRPTGMGGLGGMAAMLRGAGPREGGPERQQRIPAFLNQFLPPESPEDEALQKALDTNAPKDQIKALLAKVVEARKQKQAALEKAQSDLRELLTVQQEAIATLNGLL